MSIKPNSSTPFQSAITWSIFVRMESCFAVMTSEPKKKKLIISIRSPNKILCIDLHHIYMMMLFCSSLNGAKKKLFGSISNEESALMSQDLNFTGHTFLHSKLHETKDYYGFLHNYAHNFD